MKRYVIKRHDSETTAYLPDGCKGLTYGPTRFHNLTDESDLVHIMRRPWGMWEELVQNENCTVRILTCYPGDRLSDQRHKLRDEVFAILDQGTVVELDGEVLHPMPGDYVFIPCLVWHRLICGGPTAIRVLEVAFGTYDQDNDIERRHDIYGRRLNGQGVGST